eukprot:TRINITY_DN36803_c0_g2_i1.p1 TRINITY_DN36803_c0_g2~~TRINITY_DN36803_c0_g2_i1.p1  ORF type:complete len:445 (+),score=45.56 TRINITY_DN36803_c0_g2_i1:66-1400(+)
MLGGNTVAAREAPLTTADANADAEAFSVATSGGGREKELPARPILVLPMMACFQGYAAYVVLQHYLKPQLNASSGDREVLFTGATTLMHWGKLVARVAHDVIFAWCSTYDRCLIALVMVAVAVLIAPICVWLFDSTWMGWAFLHYGLLGLGVGVFEGNYLSVISPLGKDTKSWAIMGTPLGLATICILGQLLCSKAIVGEEGHKNNPQVLYYYIAMCVPLGIGVFLRYAPKEAVSVPQKNIVRACRDGKQWLPMMVPFFVAKFIGNFVMENTPGWFYVYNGTKVPFFSPSATTSLIDPDLFFCMIYFFVMLGDGVSRRVLYLFPQLRSWRAIYSVLFVSIACSVIGFFMQAFAIAWVTLIAAFLAFWGNGLTYAVSTRYIDSSIREEHSRAVYGIWCMIGDVGGVCGAYLVTWARTVFCGGQHYEYVCVAHAQMSALFLAWGMR